MSSLHAESVGFRYPGESADLFTGVNLIIAPGDLIALYGCNGSGKTTLARVLAGVLSPTGGELAFPRSDGWNGVGLLMQDPRSQMLTGGVRSEVAWGLQNLQLPEREIGEIVASTLRRFDLGKFANVPPERLSDGERQLVGLASIVAMQPEVLILDEATSFLDSGWREAIWEIIQEVSRTSGVLFLTARRREADRFNKVWRLESGELIQGER